MVVLRVPGDEVFDARIRKIVQDRDVSLRSCDSNYALAELRDASDVVSARLAQLAESGATWSYTLSDQAGSPHVEVGIAGDAKAARAVLADLGDRVTVVHGEAPIPL
jgi:hypothetical protein